MKIKLKIPTEHDFKILQATMGVRYWCDCRYSKDNGQTWVEAENDDDETDEAFKKEIPLIFKRNIGYKENDYWEIAIDLETGKVLNWPKGFCIDTFFKVCDDGEYVFIYDEGKILNITKEYQQYYVPSFLSLTDDGYGDYVNIYIDGDGNIGDFDKMKREIIDYFEEEE